MPVRSVDERVPRPPVVGKIRIGTYAGGRPQRSDTFVFTSPDLFYLAPLATMWGGDPESFVPQGQTEAQWRLVTNTREVVVLLPFADGRLNIDQWRELYGSGHIKRRCDEVTAQVYTVEGPEGDVRMVPEPCVCNAHGEVECDLVTRLRCWIPSAGLGVWEMQTRSVNAAFAIPDDLSLIQAYFGDDLNRVPVSLTMTPRRTTRFDKKRGERVPTTVTIVTVRLALPFADARQLLTKGIHPAELMAGTDRPALGPGTSGSPSAMDADEQPGPTAAGVSTGVSPPTPAPAATNVRGGGTGRNGEGAADHPSAGTSEVDRTPVADAPPESTSDTPVAGATSRTEPAGAAASPKSWPDEETPAPPATPSAEDPKQHRHRGEPNGVCLTCGYMIEAHRPDQGRML